MMPLNDLWKRDGVLAWVVPRIAGKDVLDVGCVEHSLDRRNRERVWVHDVLRQNAGSLLGIDIACEDIERLHGLGYNVVCENAEGFDLGATFDVIFAGELIEHLANPGTFLECCRQHLRDDGTLILTTPNAFSVYRLFSTIGRWTNDPYANAEHTCWYSPRVLQSLLRRYGFAIRETCFVDFPYVAPRLKHRLTGCLSTLLGRKFKDTMIVFAGRRAE